MHNQLRTGLGQNVRKTK